MTICEEVLTMHPNLKESVSTAYEKSLKRYHGWFIQKAFGVCIELKILWNLKPKPASSFL